jgi:UDP-N-acetyl-D-mannosaminuronate dehydrogenase
VHKQAKTLVIGLGEVGAALAQVLERTAPVLKHDLEPRAFDDPVGVMHLCLPFTDKERFEQAALGYIERFKPALTIVNSTVLPGTTRAIQRRSGRPAAYSPVRGKHVRMVEDLVRYKKFVAACDPDAARLAEEHFRHCGMTTHRLERPETLELAKLAETTYFGVLIAYAQELNRYAAAAGADYQEAIRFFDEVDFLPRVRYFPGFIGGHCVIPNLQLLRQIAPLPLLEAVLDSNCRRARELLADPGPEQAGGRP